ncbi:MAG: class I SAM-dependent methyltransferase [Candidatus Schekmanbacteria bacterium]|nr:class I SAM-dependent methyltransferase [Candidatus Schekmanbacteria bacterium]
MNDNHKNQTATKQTWEDFWKARTRQKNSFIPLLNLVNDLTMVRKSVHLAMKYSQKGTVLQAGSGEARNSIALAKKRGDRVVALDFSPEALILAKAKAAEHNITIQLIEGNIEHMNFADNSLELVWNEGVMEHIVDPLPLLKEMKRVGKTVICIVPSMSGGWKLAKLIKKALKADEGIKENFYYYHTPESLKKLFQDAGFKTCLVKEIRILFFIKHLAGIGLN